MSIMLLEKQPADIATTCSTSAGKNAKSCAYLYIRRTKTESGFFFRADQLVTSSALYKWATCPKMNQKWASWPSMPYAINSRQEIVVFCTRRKNFFLSYFGIVQRICAGYRNDLAFCSYSVFLSIKPPDTSPAQTCPAS